MVFVFVKQIVTKWTKARCAIPNLSKWVAEQNCIRKWTVMVIIAGKNQNKYFQFCNVKLTTGSSPAA
jgi:hypothetical protein